MSKSPSTLHRETERLVEYIELKEKRNKVKDILATDYDDDSLLELEELRQLVLSLSEEDLPQDLSYEIEIYLSDLTFFIDQVDEDESRYEEEDLDDL